MTKPTSSSQVTFHCGLPKTGSTYLQKVVFPHAEGGTYIPGKWAFTHFVDFMTSAQGPVLVSDERFTWTPLERADFEGHKRERMLAYLAHTWPGSKLLVFLREPSEMIKSHYAQYLHDGGPHTFEVFCKHHIHLDAFRFEQLLASIGEMPWRDVLLLDYKDMFERPKLVVALVEEFTGMRFPNWKPMDRSSLRNVSVAGYGAWLLRMINTFMLWGDPPPEMGLPQTVLRRRRRVRRWVQNGPLRFLNRAGPSLVSKTVLQEIKGEFAVSWAEVLKCIEVSQKGRFHAEER